jgi:hypothetical protein
MPSVTQHTPEQTRRNEAFKAREADARRQKTKEIEAVVAEIQKLRQDADGVALKLTERSEHLRKLARTSLDEGASNYLVFANAHLRLAGALAQGFRRTVPMDRLLQAAEDQRLDAERREMQAAERQLAREKAHETNRLTIPQDDDFDELYGDIVTEADDA